MNSNDHEKKRHHLWMTSRPHKNSEPLLDRGRSWVDFCFIVEYGEMSIRALKKKVRITKRIKFSFTERQWTRQLFRLWVMLNALLIHTFSKRRSAQRQTSTFCKEKKNSQTSVVVRRFRLFIISLQEIKKKSIYVCWRTTQIIFFLLHKNKSQIRAITKYAKAGQ